MDVLGGTTLGYNFDALNQKSQDFVQGYFEYIEQLLNPVWQLFPSLAYLPFPMSKRAYHSVEVLQKYIVKLMKIHSENFKKGIKSERACMIELAMKSVFAEHPVLSEREFSADLAAFFVAGIIKRQNNNKNEQKNEQKKKKKKKKQVKKHQPRVFHGLFTIYRFIKTFKREYTKK